MRRRIACACLGALASIAVTPPAAARTPAVSPTEALRITAQLAKTSPPLPPAVAALVNPAGRTPDLKLRRAFDDALERYAASGEHDHDDYHWEKNGLGCYAQGFDAEGKLVHRNEHDMNDNGKLDPWELNPNRNETCREVVLLAYDRRDPDRGSFTLEIRTEKDPASGRVFKRTASRWNYVVDASEHHHECAPSASQWRAATRFVERGRRALAKYVNNPMLAAQDGYLPYPIPGTKTFHWFNRARWNDGYTLDPYRIEMFVAAITDDGWRPVNIAPIYHYTGNDPVAFDPNTDPYAKSNAGAGCLVQWHRHLEGGAGAEGAATGNTDGRDWMGHLWIYGGLYPFGDKDIDGSEPHGWFAPLNNVTALCTSAGSGL